MIVTLGKITHFYMKRTFRTVKSQQKTTLRTVRSWQKTPLYNSRNHRDFQGFSNVYSCFTNIFILIRTFFQNNFKSFITSFTNQRHINTYEFTSFLADTRFQNNLYSQVTNRQVRRPGFVKTEQSRLVFYFDIHYVVLYFERTDLYLKLYY